MVKAWGFHILFLFHFQEVLLTGFGIGLVRNLFVSGRQIDGLSRRRVDDKQGNADPNY